LIRNRYYVSHQHALHGPYTVEELATFLAPDTLVCREGEDRWQTAAAIDELQPLLARAAQPAAPPDAEYHALVDGKEYGPYSLEQLKEFVKSSTPVRNGARREWQEAGTLPALAGFFAAAAATDKVEESALKDWFFLDAAGAQHGPFSRNEVEDLLRREVLTGEMQIRHLNWAEPRLLKRTHLFRAAAPPIRDRRPYLVAVAGLVALLLMAGLVFRFQSPAAEPVLSPPEPHRPAPAIAAAEADSTALPPIVYSDSVAPAGDEFFSTSPVSGDPAAGKLMVKVVDVGQGDGIIIRTPEGRFYLVDAGPYAQGMNPWLEKLGVTSIDGLLLSHPHNDHYAGFPAILERWPVKTFYDVGGAHPSRQYAAILATILDSGIAYMQPRAGDSLDWGKGVCIEILHPDSPVYGNLNNNSIVFILRYGSTSMLFAGDAEEAAHQAMLASRPDRLKADIYKVGHHGSDNATTAAWLDAIRPRTAVISCGLANRFGHPKPATIALLHERNIPILRTDFMGTITLISDGHSWSTLLEATPYERIARPLPDSPAESGDPGAWRRVEPGQPLLTNGETGAPGLRSAEALQLHDPLAGERWLIAAERSTRAGATALVLLGGGRDCLELRLAEGGGVELTSCRSGRRSTERYRLRGAPRFLAIERAVDRLNLAASSDGREWFVLSRLALGKFNFSPDQALLGLTSGGFARVAIYRGA